MDDAALVTQRPGFDLVITKDAIVQGVHFLSTDPLDTVARKLLRVSLSDLAAKGARPYAYLMACAWPAARGWEDRERFAGGLAADQEAFDLTLLGGDTVSIDGPMVFSATMLGWVPAGRMVRRSGAQAGDLIQVSGVIGDGLLGLMAAKGQLSAFPRAMRESLAERYRLPNPRLDLDLSGASAAADVSDGLIADAGHIGEASGRGIELDLSAMPLSAAAKLWLGEQPDKAAARVRLASGGDDYEIVAAAPAPLPGFTVIGKITEGGGVRALIGGVPVDTGPGGYRHGNES